MSLPDATTDFRASYRRQRVSSYYSGPLHFVFTAAASLAIIGWCLARLDAVTPLEWLTVPVTLVYANLSEYLGHRGPMHHPTRGLRIIYARHTKEHHVFFTDERMAMDDTADYMAVLFPPIMLVFFMGAFALPVGLVLAWLAGANVAYLFVATALAYFLNYELLHFAYHLPETSRVYTIPFMTALRHHHRMHHRPSLMSRYNFNITYPVADWLFGTLYKDKINQI